MLIDLDSAASPWTRSLVKNPALTPPHFAGHKPRKNNFLLPSQSLPPISTPPNFRTRPTPLLLYSRSRSMKNSALIARNRANASHSTGPKTEAGKKRSSLNAYRHGLTGQTIILPAEDLDEIGRASCR